VQVTQHPDADPSNSQADSAKPMPHDGPIAEDEAFDGVRQLILAGEYQDTRYIEIGPPPEPPRRLADGTVDPASASRYLNHIPVSKQVERGSPEYTVARDGGLLTPLPCFRRPRRTRSRRLRMLSATAAQAAAAAVPRSGQRGFGPHTGILGVRGGVPSGDWDDLVQLHLAHRADDDSLYPLWLIGFFEWGCAIWSLIDCRDPAGPMWSWDGNDHTLRQQTIADWLALWLECCLKMPEGTAPPSTEKARIL